MNKKIVILFGLITTLLLANITLPARASDNWISGISWSNLHVKSEEGVFENFHREWKVEKPGDLFSSAHIDLNSPTQHNQAWVRTDQNKFTTTYSGGVANANKTVTFMFQGYDSNGDAMDYTISSPGLSDLAQPIKATVAGGQTYLGSVTVTTDSNGYAEATTTHKSTPAAYDSIIASIATKLGDVSATTKNGVVVIKKKPRKTKNVTTVTYAKLSSATANTIYQYSLGDSNVWINAPASPFTIAQTTQSIKMQALDVIGPEIATWQPAGWRPIIKLFGTPTGRQCVENMTVYLCSSIDFRDQTFDWSVANRPWFQGGPNYDYAQAYAKTYTPGSKVELKFYVRDIWGDPIANLPLTVALNGGAAVKWNNYKGSITTDAKGFADFSATNKNTVKQVESHVDINPDPPHKKTKGVLGFVATVTSNEVDEVADLMWFQMVSDITIVGGCPNTPLTQCGLGSAEFPFTKRGPNVTDTSGSYPIPNGSQITNTVADGQTVTFTVNNSYQPGDIVRVTSGSIFALRNKNLVVDTATSTQFTVKDKVPASSSSSVGDVGLAYPSLTLDPNGTSLDDVVIAALNLKWVTNTKNLFIWAPEVKITATNGGLSAVASAAQKDNGFQDFKNSSNFKANNSFGFTYFQDLLFMATQPGVTTWTISIGNWSYSFSQKYVAAQ